MDRRIFLKTMGISSLGLVSVGHAIANNNYSVNKKAITFSPQELKNALNQFINRYFNGELFNPNEPLPNQTILIADGFDVVPVYDKNTIFDVADLVIEKCHKVGFDASSLKKGIVPRGMIVGRSGYTVRTSEAVYTEKLEELKDYDAIVKYHKGILISSTLPPIQWKTVKKIKATHTSQHGNVYMDARRKLTIKTTPHQHKAYIKIQTLKPNLIMAPDQKFRVPVSKEIAMKYLKEDTQKLIHNNLIY